MAFTQSGSSSMTVPRPKWKSFVRSARIVDGGKPENQENILKARTQTNKKLNMMPDPGLRPGVHQMVKKKISHLCALPTTDALEHNIFKMVIQY